MKAIDRDVVPPVAASGRRHGGGLTGAMYAQCGWYFAPCSIQRLKQRLVALGELVQRFGRRHHLAFVASS